VVSSRSSSQVGVLGIGIRKLGYSVPHETPPVATKLCFGLKITEDFKTSNAWSGLLWLGAGRCK